MTSDEEMKSVDTVVNLDIWRGNNKVIYLYMPGRLGRKLLKKKEIRLLHNGRRNIQLADISHR